MSGGGGGPAAEAVRPAEGAAARERRRPGGAGPPVGGAGGGGETARRWLDGAAAGSVSVAAMEGGGGGRRSRGRQRRRGRKSLLRLDEFQSQKAINRRPRPPRTSPTRTAAAGASARKSPADGTHHSQVCADSLTLCPSRSMPLFGFHCYNFAASMFSQAN